MANEKPATSDTFADPLGVPDPNAPPVPPPGTASPPPAKGAAKAKAPDPTAKVIDDPADASHEDVMTAQHVDEDAAPAPFSKRDGLPDITSESVNLRLLKDYWPVDTARFGVGMRARAGELRAFPSDEALDLIRTGIAEREEDDALVAARADIAALSKDPPA